MKEKKNWKQFRNKLLLLKKKSPQNLAAYLNVFKLLSSLRFFKANKNKYPFDELNYLSYTFLKRYLYSFFFLYFFNFFKGISFFFKKAIRLKFLKRRYYNLINAFKKWKKRINIVRKRFVAKLKHFKKLKYKGKRLGKVWYLKNNKFVDKKKLKKTRNEKIFEKRAPFIKKVIANKYKFRAKYFALKRVLKKVTKKQFKFIKKKRTLRHALKKLAYNLIYVKQKLRKGQRKKDLKRWLRHKYKGNFKEREAAAKKEYKLLYKNKKLVRRYLKGRRKRFWFKYFLIKKYKRIFFRRKRRTGILHFRMYYSNYYVTLTDLSHNVIYTCSAGSVSSSGNKKTKMSHVVAMPMFFRIKFFLRAFKIRNLKFVFRTRMDKMFFIALNYFVKKGYKIKTYSMVHRAPHHLGQRKQKPRRI